MPGSVCLGVYVWGIGVSALGGACPGEGGLPRGCLPGGVYTPCEQNHRQV